MNIEWSDGYRIGHDPIDQQHQQLFTLANKVFAATTQPAYKLATMELYAYVHSHFAEEEALMRSINYPAYSKHVQMHTAMISRLNTISKGIDKNQFKNAEINDFMKKWLLQHIAHHDTMIAAYMRHHHV